MSDDYQVDDIDGGYRLVWEPEDTAPDEVVEHLEEYGFEESDSNAEAGVYRAAFDDAVEVYAEDDRVEVNLYQDEEPGDFLASGIVSIMQGEDVPLDMDYLQETDLHDELAELYEDAQDMDIVLDIDSEYGDVGAMTRGSPKR